MPDVDQFETFYGQDGNTVPKEKMGLAKSGYGLYSVRRSFITHDPINPFTADMLTEMHRMPDWQHVDKNTFDKYISFLKTRRVELFQFVLNNFV